jgi:hypothetical protein
LQESGVNARIQTNPLGHLEDVRAHFFSQVADLMMKLIFSARNALAAYLINSAEDKSVEISGTAPMPSGRGMNVGAPKV